MRGVDNSNRIINRRQRSYDHVNSSKRIYVTMWQIVKKLSEIEKALKLKSRVKFGNYSRNSLFNLNSAFNLLLDQKRSSTETFSKYHKMNSQKYAKIFLFLFEK